jgi:hypothetical protein
VLAARRAGMVDAVLLGDDFQLKYYRYPKLPDCLNRRLGAA